jgi:hypothetical protein
MPKFQMPKITAKLVAQSFAVATVTVAAAASLATIASQLAYPADSVRSAALNVASLVVAFLLVAGIGQGQKDKT